MSLPSLSARIQIWDLSRKSGLLPPGSLAPPVSLGEGRNPFLWAFRQQKSIQKCKPSSFFCTNTMALHQALWLGLMAPDSNISFKWFLTSSTISGGIRLNGSLKGVLSVTFIICSVEWVQPNSARSNENTSWYLARSWQAASASSWGPWVQAA